NTAGIAEIYDTLCGNLNRFLASGTRYLHRRPSLEWGRNPGNTRVARYDADGKAVAYTIGTPESGTSGNTFMGNASIGGIWYTGRGGSYPTEFNNTFIVGDYGGRTVKRVKVEFTDVVTAVDDLASEIGLIACMAENPIDGSIVYITFDHPLINNDPAGVHKLVYGGNIPPLAKITLPAGAKNYTAQSNLNLQLKGEESFDPTPGGSIAYYEWDFGDGQTSTDMNPLHNFVAPDNAPIMYVVKLKVTDDEEGEAEKEILVSLNNLPPTVQITSPVHGSTYRVADDTTYQLRATVTDDHLAPAQLTYAWQTTLVHNNHTHPSALDPRQEPGAIIKRVGCTDQYSWLITVKVTDEAGLSAEDTVRMTPQCTGALPILLHKFSVTQNASVNIVKWSTELEANMEYFEVERSSDGVNFETLNRQDARNTSGSNQYTYSDRDFPPGYNYYRLKIVEHGD
ncbi:MAG: PKD domain-containing protein, partial [Sphingobacteriales bacterium]